MFDTAVLAASEKIDARGCEIALLRNQSAEQGEALDQARELVSEFVSEFVTSS
jgi:hypothetical protein